MTSQTQRAVAALRNTTPMLDVVTDKANAAVRKAEFVLNEVGAGLPVQVEFDQADELSPSGDENHGYEEADRFLAYERFNSTFRICIVHETWESSRVDVDGRLDGAVRRNRRVQPWDQCDRETRLVAIKVLGKLIEELAAKAGSVSEQAEAAIQSASEIMAALEDSNPLGDPFDLEIVGSYFRSDSPDIINGPRTCYIDRETRQLLQIYDEDDTAAGFGVGEQDAENNAAMRARVASDPGRYVEVPMNGTPDCLGEFVDSQWTDDQTLRDEAASVYHQHNGRYRTFKDNAPSEAVDAFYSFQEQQLGKEFGDWLRENNLID